MPSTAQIIKSLIEKHGGKKTVIADKLKKTGVAGLEKMSSQRLGQYANGKMKPKPDFYKAWKQVFNEDIESMTETNVSRETNKVSAMDIVESENYIGMHRRVYDTLEKNMETHRILMMQMSETIKNLTGNQKGSPGGKQVSLPRE